MSNRNSNSWISTICQTILLAAILAVATFNSKIDTTIGNWLSDSVDRYQISTKNSDLVIVAVDPESIASIGTWPWDRTIYSAALGILESANIRSLFVDIDFSSSSNPLADQKLWQAVERYGKENKIYLPVFLQYANASKDSLILTRPPIEEKHNIQFTSVNVAPDASGLVRELSGGFDIGKSFYPSAASLLADRAGQSTSIDFSINPDSFKQIRFIDLFDKDFDTSSLSGKNVLLGATAVELGDNVAVPLHRSLPGVLVQALAAQTLASGPLLKLDRAVAIAVVFSSLWLISIPVMRRGWKFQLSAMLAIGVLATGLLIYVSHDHRIQLSFALPGIFTVGLIAYFALSRINRSTVENLQLRFSVQKRESILGAVFENSNDYMFCVNENNQIQYISNSLCTLLGLDTESVHLKPVTSLVSNYHSLLMESLQSLNERYVANRTEVISSQNESIPVEISFNKILTRDGQYHAVILRDLREQIKREQELLYQSLHDKLTDLPNRKSLSDNLGTIFEERGEVTLFLICLNHFKEINDLYGHECGDAVLVSFAKRLKAHSKREMCSFRLDGAVFALTFKKKLGKSDIEEQAKMLQYITKQPIAVENYSVELDLSIGVAHGSGHARFDTTEILRQGDIALQNCRENHQLFAIFDATLKNEQVAFLEIIPLLRKAIQENQLQIHFQPKVDLNDQSVVGCEMLTRWVTEDGVNVPPDLFIKIAENSQLMESLMLNSLFQLADLEKDWKNWKLPKKVAINLSSRLLGNTSFISEMISCVDTLLSHLDVEFEITETALMANPTVALRSIAAIKDSGHTISIDDFGVGYSSLAYIRDLGADILKIDKSFIDDILENEDSQVIVRSTIGMAHELNIKVVAEGIEEDKQARFLKAMHCDYGQGWLYAKAMDFRGYAKWCKMYNCDVAYVHERKSAS